MATRHRGSPPPRTCPKSTWGSRSLSEAALALSTPPPQGLDAAASDDFAARANHRVAILSDAKAEDPVAQRVARLIFATPFC
eukprot:3055226-Pyramimonas_sp.AAC.1